MNLFFLLMSKNFIVSRDLKNPKDAYELSITKNYRLTFDIEGDTYVLRKVGTHTDILGRKNRLQNQKREP